LANEGFTVVETASIGDAASAVRVIMGPHVKTAGQVADYRHNVAEYARDQGYASAIGFWSQDREWLVAVTLPPGEDWCEVKIYDFCQKFGLKSLHEVEAEEAAAHKRLVLGMERWQQEQPEREALAAKLAQERLQLREQYRELFAAAVAALPRNRRGEPNGGMLNLVQYWYGCVCKEPDHGYGQADYDHALKMLQYTAADAAVLG
jgi:hypothetical protein